MSLTEELTFNIPADLAEQVREAVSAGEFPTVDELASHALKRELKRLRDERLRTEFAEASQDPMFLADQAETMEAFAILDAETARALPREP